MESIKNTVNNVMGLLVAKKNLSHHSPETLLKKTLTKKELQHIKFRYFRKGILGISVDSSGWLYQMNLKKEGLLERLGKNINVKDIRFRLGALR